ncbi:unnamed protein product [Ceratitis capitata]|uniref:(Mediterranean fruit fly) hypothetical protein n=1 Tax=Ceratitis capitata TaxID=7213 RepID=A0A811VA72_CERCA|nr:unnamed protein product [Ceratitis capitata]
MNFECLTRIVVVIINAATEAKTTLRTVGVNDCRDSDNENNEKKNKNKNKNKTSTTALVKLRRAITTNLIAEIKSRSAKHQHQHQQQQLRAASINWFGLQANIGPKKSLD